ncbi:MAG: tetratricopeptide repeat family protein [Rhodocyclales bacterium]|nr:tetratricopeptide repeat family protein [Rhodocyclales bacterium]
MQCYDPRLNFFSRLKVKLIRKLKLLFLSNMTVLAFVISKIKTHQRNAIYIFVATWVAGCASFQGAADLPEGSKLLQEGAQALVDGQKEKGLALLSASARANPASADPWAKIAQVQFDAENYPAAIVAADEAQKRDPNRKETKAISVVASLRVAVRALTDMREDASLRGNTRSEAERLARMLRETLGQDVLVPVPVPEEPHPPARRANPAANSAPPAAAAPAPGAAPASRVGARKPTERTAPPSPKRAAEQSSSAPSGGGANPFSVLK